VGKRKRMKSFFFSFFIQGPESHHHHQGEKAVGLWVERKKGKEKDPRLAKPASKGKKKGDVSVSQQQQKEEGKVVFFLFFLGGCHQGVIISPSRSKKASRFSNLASCEREKEEGKLTRRKKRERDFCVVGCGSWCVVPRPENENENKTKRKTETKTKNKQDRQDREEERTREASSRQKGIKQGR
jgi:hypothetical protein